MLTNTLVASLHARAGAAFDWAGTKSSRPPSTWRSALKAHLYAAQDGRCFDCGNSDVIESLEFCHIVSRGNVATSDKGKGWVPGNIALGHRVCPCGTRGNKAQQMRGPIVLPEHITRPDLVAVEWPTPPTLKATYPR